MSNCRVSFRNMADAHSQSMSSTETGSTMTAIVLIPDMTLDAKPVRCAFQIYCIWVARCSHWYVCTVLIVVQQLSALPGRGGSTSAGLSVEETGARFHLLPFRNLSNFVHPTLSLFFRRDTRSRQLIYLVSVSGEINSPHMHYRRITCYK